LENIVYSNSRLKKRFFVFLGRFGRSASKFAKSANMIQKIFFFKFFRKNAEFDANFKSVEKVAKKFTQKKESYRAENFVHSTER
jgi:hypothetical protein